MDDCGRIGCVTRMMVKDSNLGVVSPGVDPMYLMCRPERIWSKIGYVQDRYVSFPSNRARQTDPMMQTKNVKRLDVVREGEELRLGS